MKKALLLLTCSVFVNTACLTGDGDNDDGDGTTSPTASPTASPVPTATPGTGDFTLTMNGRNYDSSNGEEAFVRVVDTTPTQIACGQATVTDDEFTIVLPNALIDGEDHTIEIFVNTDQNVVYDDGVDERWVRDVIAASADESRNINGNAGQANTFTWPAGVGCP